MSDIILLIVPNLKMVYDNGSIPRFLGENETLSHCFAKARSEPERNKDLNILRPSVRSFVRSSVRVLSDNSCLQDCQQLAFHLYIIW